MADRSARPARPLDEIARNKAFAFVGLVLFFTGLVVTGFNGYFTILSAGLCVVGALVGCLIFLPRVTRNLGLYVNMGLYSAFVVGTLVVLFLVLQRHPHAYDSTAGKMYSVSDVSRSFLRRLDRPVRATAFLTDNDKEEAARLLGEYERYSPDFKYRIVNPFRDVNITRRYGLGVVPGDVYLETETSDTATVGNLVKVTKLNEEELTNGIIQLLRGQRVTLYCLTGHGELATKRDDASAALTGRRQQATDNMVWLAEQLERAQVRVLPLALAQRGKVPADASAVLCVAPKTDISGAEREALSAYLAGGGRAMFLLNPELPQVGRDLRTPLRNIAELLEEYSIVLPRDILATAQSAQNEVADFSIPVKMLRHRIAQVQGDEPLIFNQCRPILPSTSPSPSLVMEPVLESAVPAMRIPIEEVSKAMAARRKLEISSKDVEVGVQPLGLAVTMQPPGAPEERATRILAVGNGTFVSTELITQKGWLLFQNSVNWLTNSADLVAIPAAQIENTPIVLSSGEKQFLFLLLVIIVPVLVGILGLGYCVTKRELA